LSTLSETDASTCGFLGSGKTSTLQNLLQITGGYKVGVVINDVASVNIDAKYPLFFHCCDKNDQPFDNYPLK